MTRAMLTGVLGWCLVLAATAAPARADTKETKAPQPYVVLIGIGQYADKDILTRPHAEDDVKALYDLLSDPRYLPGIDAAHVRLLLGSEDAKRKSQPATRENILKALKWLKENAHQDDPVIFVFIGQGGSMADNGDRLCYFASDSTVKGRAKDAIAAADIAQELDTLKSQRFAAVVDTTFKGFMVGKEPAPEPNLEKDLYKEFLGSEGKEEKSSAPGRVLFLASIGKKESPDLKEHGIFTQVLLDGLKGAADKEGYEPDGVVTVDELTEYVDKEIREVSRTEIKDDDKRPDPIILGGRGTHFVLVHNPAVAAKVQERLDKFEKLVKDSKLSDKLADEGRELLARMPRLKAQQELRKAYQQLVDGTLSLDKLQSTRETIVEKTRLKRTEALSFAEKVMKATQILRDHYVKEVNQGELVGWAVRGIYRRLDEKLPTEVQERLARVKDMKEAELTVFLADVRERLGAREDLADHKDLDIALQRMTGHLDPYTTYIDPETVQRMRITINGDFSGIGIQIRKDPKTDMIQVISPLLNSPAYKKGLLAGDLISVVTVLVDDNGDPVPTPQPFPTKGMPLNDVVKKILGKPGTPVKLTIEREGVKEPLQIEVTRNRIQTESVLGFKRKGDDSWDYMIDPQTKIAYVRLTQFQTNTASDLERLMAQLTNDGVKGLVLDLRFNPGGLLSSAVRVSDLYIDDGLIVTIRPRVADKQEYKGHKAGSYLDIPMVCMVNDQSASGSEIVAACLQDHNRAVILGERSYGKGSVQNIQEYENGELKLTTATFWRPNGKNLNKSSTTGKDDEDWGVRPDPNYEVKLTRKEQEDLFEHQTDATIIPRKDRPAKAKPEFKDRQLEKALDYLRDRVKVSSRTPK